MTDLRPDPVLPGPFPREPLPPGRLAPGAGFPHGPDFRYATPPPGPYPTRTGPQLTPPGPPQQLNTRPPTGPGNPPLPSWLANLGALPWAVIGLSVTVVALQVLMTADSYLAAALTSGQIYLADPGWQVVQTFQFIYTLPIPLLLAAWIVTSIWLYTERRQVAQSPHRLHAAWTWLAWVVPIVWLWFPLKVVQDIARAKVGDALRSVWFPWWSNWLAGTLLGSLSAHLWDSTTDPTMPDEQYYEMVGWLPHLDLAVAACLAGALVFWVRIVVKIAGARPFQNSSVQPDSTSANPVWGWDGINRPTPQ